MTFTSLPRLLGINREADEARMVGFARFQGLSTGKPSRRGNHQAGLQETGHEVGA